MSSAPVICPVCKLAEPQIAITDAGMRYRVNCLMCGDFIITRLAAETIEIDEHWNQISAWIRAQQQSTEIPEITRDNLGNILSSLRSYSVSEKHLLLLRLIEQRTSFPGQATPIQPETEYPLIWASSYQEMEFLLNSLVQRGLLKIHVGFGIDEIMVPTEWSITADGWDYLDKHHGSFKDTDQVFVAMSFSEEMRRAWDVGIRPAIKSVGYRPYRIDDVPHTDRIDVKIMAEIKSSKFVIADVTDQRPGVYFEAGYALGLGLQVIWSVRSDDIANIHFDTRQYNHIVWETEEELAEKIKDFVTAIIGTASKS